MTLHLIQKSPFASSVLADCLSVTNKNDAVLLMQDGTYACKLDDFNLGAFNKYALNDDLQARGLTEIHKSVNIISYDEFVTLCTQYTRVISWY